MSHFDEAVGVLLIIFIAGILAGILVIMVISFHRDPLKGDPPDTASAGVRWLVQVGRRDGRRGPAPDFPRAQPDQDREVDW
jgi:hypothetical protein